MVRPAARREVARYLQQRYEVSERRACRTIIFLRSTLRYRSRLDPRTALRIRMRDIAYSRVRYGYRRVRVMLLREGWWQISKNLVYRLYRKVWPFGSVCGAGGDRQSSVTLGRSQRQRTRPGRWTASPIN